MNIIKQRKEKVSKAKVNNHQYRHIYNMNNVKCIRFNNVKTCTYKETKQRGW